MNTFDHKKLVTHGIATTDESQGPVTAVLFDMKAFKEAKSTLTDNPDSMLIGTPLFKLSDIHPDALNLLMASVHLYQMVIRNSIGLEHMKKEIAVAQARGAIGFIFGSELISWIDELQQLNRATRTLVIDGQQPANNQLFNGDGKPS